MPATRTKSEAFKRVMRTAPPRRAPTPSTVQTRFDEEAPPVPFAPIIQQTTTPTAPTVISPRAGFGEVGVTPAAAGSAAAHLGVIPTAAAPRISGRGGALPQNIQVQQGNVFDGTLGSGISGGFQTQGQAFQRDQANLTPQGVVSAGQSAMRTPSTPQPPAPQGPRRPTTPPDYKNHLEYLDSLRAVDPERAAEVARFQAATIGRSSPEIGLATDVFFTERAVFEWGKLARNASENVWDVIAQRLGTGQTGAELLTQRGYVPIGGGLWYLGRLGAGGGSNIATASPRNLGTGGGGGGGGGGFENGDSGARFLSNASAGLFSWRIGA